MPDSACPRCQSTKLYAFEADRTARMVKNVALPVVCRDCGQVLINGTTVAFPEEFELRAKTMAEAAAAAGAQAVADLRGNPNTQIATYFSGVYRNAYLDGFWRAVMFLQHNAKEGRLVRLKQLWHGRSVPPKTIAGRVLIEMDETVYHEFNRLLEIGTDATRCTNISPSVPAGHAPVSK